MPNTKTPKDSETRLYLITPERLDPDSFADTLAAALDGGDVACVQLRLKNIDDAAIIHAAKTLAPIAQSRDVAFILNDRADLAAQTGCDGVHIGQSDGSYKDARALMGDDAIIGVTCHDSRHLAMTAAEQGADYVAFGAFYPTTSKETTTHPEPDLLAWWTEMMEVPCVAIGGITADNCAPLIQAGADFIAVLSAVWNHEDGAGEGVKALNAAIKAVQKSET
ncbi:MAG: thiamine phosphate synthase [Rhodospirillales bacterium]|jgi:thiamine-phosphate pyrophosphorylase|nr:thiamine phosphate synthase [Rhodospirillales bacterium]MBT4006777.1 thiamine phosphate synthase [Rhodospirillales bacterium]MBT5077269.1 thiamine phosphate synthase [Rhodospirillales bacterium]MBT5113688.1 thiamine phosphate synthase [Rhodospirillales bacterium]MBT5673999.1 thiamine phosphate synthase [Rhodospirillales bacterium]